MFTSILLFYQHVDQLTQSNSLSTVLTVVTEVKMMVKKNSHYIL